MDAGKYEVQLHYTCPADDVGSTIELSCGNSKVTSKITVPHDPPVRGDAEDRFRPRAESFVKDFRAMSLGTIELNQGRQTLTLRATEIPGETAAEFRLLLFVRQ